MILKEIFYAVKCNRCGILHEGSDYSYFSQEGDAIESAYESEWCEFDDKHYCPDCFTFTDEDQEEVKVKEPYPDKLVKLRKFLEKVLNVRTRIFEKDDQFTVKVNIYNSKTLLESDEMFIRNLLDVSIIQKEEKKYSEIEYTITFNK
jgi:hypothetical protein